MLNNTLIFLELLEENQVIVYYADNWKKEENAQLTEAEIKKVFEWAWQFAEEVKK